MIITERVGWARYTSPTHIDFFYLTENKEIRKPLG
jgi:hypothetical protein